MKKTVKIVILLCVPIVIVLINVLNISDYFFNFLILFFFIVLPYLASKKDGVTFKKFIKTFFLMFLFALFLIELMGGVKEEYFFIFIPIFLLMILQQYSYRHYFFALLSLYTLLFSMGRFVSGYLFPLNFGFSILIPLLTFYTTYVLSEQLLKISHKIALSFAFSYAFMVLGAFILDVSYLYTRELDVLWSLKEYGSHDFLLNSSIFIGLVGIFLFFYGAYLMYQED